MGAIIATFACMLVMAAGLLVSVYAANRGLWLGAGISLLIALIFGSLMVDSIKEIETEYQRTIAEAQLQS